MQRSRAVAKFPAAFVATVVALGALASCGGGGGAKSSSRASKVPPQLRAALTSAQPVKDAVAGGDEETHILLDEAGLRAKFGAATDAVYALLDKARRQIVAAQTRPDLAHSVRTKAYVTGPPEVRLLDDTLLQNMSLLFAQQFADGLDGLTGSGESGTGSEDVPDTKPLKSDDGTRTVTDRIDSSWGIDVAGSRVTTVMSAKLTETITDDKTHALLAWVTEERTYKGVIDVCPDPSGGVPLTITTRVRIQTSSGKTVSSDATLDEQGHVNDQASLASVDASYENHSSWPGAGIDLSMGNMVLPGNANGYDGSSLNTAGATGSLDTSGDAAAGLKFAVGDLGLSVNIFEPVMEAAQKLWRNGRCVVVAVPKYDAETPRDVKQQGRVQHTEEVDKKSETTFGVALKHRYGAAPIAPVDLALSGEDKIEPDHLDSGSGSVTYTAPDEEGKTATLTLTSTSKRGIGKLLIAFSTKSKKLALSMSGSMTFGLSGVTLNAHFTAARAELKPVGDGTYRVSLPATTSYDLTFPGENCTSASGTEGSGTIVYNGTLDEGADKLPVWHLQIDSQRSFVHTNENACGKSFADATLSGAGGGLVGALASTAGPITMPAAGGTVHVNKSIAGLAMNLTYVGTVPK